jgi:threonine/homoserine/homoserine lactone efflux protein
VLFTIFLFGPCEPLLPLLMYPAATGGWWQVTLVVLVFALATLTAMLAAVAVGLAGARRFRFERLERYADALAGAAVAACGVAVTLGL